MCDGVVILTQFKGLSGPLKTLGVSAAALYAAKKLITATAGLRGGRLQCSRLVGVILHCPREKSVFPAMRPYVKNSLTTCSGCLVCRHMKSSSRLSSAAGKVIVGEQSDCLRVASSPIYPPTV